MTILDRYIFKRLLAVNAIIFFSLFGVIFLIEALMANASGHPDGSAAVGIILNSFGVVLDFVNIVYPFIFLLSAVITIIMLNNRYEMVAVRCIGMRDKRIARPFFVLAFLVATLFYLNQSYFIRTVAPNNHAIQEANANWHAYSNFLVAQSKNDDAEPSRFALVLNSSKTLVNGIFRVFGKTDVQYLALNDHSRKLDLSDIISRPHRSKTNYSAAALGSLEFLPLEVLVGSIFNAENKSIGKFLFVVAKKISQFLIFFVFAYAAIIIANTPIRTYSFVPQTIAVMLVWLSMFVGELLGAGMYEAKKIPWFLGATMGLWTCVLATAGFYARNIGKTSIRRFASHFVKSITGQSVA